MNPDLGALHPYPFEKLAALLATESPPAEGSVLRLSVGEPQHPPPSFVLDTMVNNLELLARYPATRGNDELRESVSSWLQRRHGLQRLDPATQVLPVTGTREALFAIAQTCVGHGRGALVGCPNPFYQIYEGAALLAGAETALLPTTADRGFLPDPEGFSEQQWQRMELLYLCTPGNPAGAVMDVSLLQQFVRKALQYDVVLVSDECYSEIYPIEDEAPPGLLLACQEMGVDDFQNCISMHSLSKRSNLPGLRSGFAAGDARILADYLRYRGYHGCAMPPHHQLASCAAWDDEAHVLENRQRYRDKFAAVVPLLSSSLTLNEPAGGFYLWPETPIDDESFARRLYAEEGVVVLPGSYLGRDGEGGNPGAHRVRMALVAEQDDCVEAAQRIARFVGRL